MRVFGIAIVVFGFAVLGWAVPALAQSSGPARVAARVSTATFLVASFADLATTEYGIGAGTLHEQNPVLRWAERRPVAMAITKGGIATAAGYALLKLHTRHPRWAFVLGATATAATAWAASHNRRALE